MMLLHFTGLALAAAVGTAPNTSGRFDLRAVADSEPVLTVAAITSMTTFWSSFMKEPDSIRTAGRKANQEDLSIYIGSQPTQTKGVNITAMAAKYPSVAADLKKSGLTAAQWEAYRAALVSAWLTKQEGGANAASVLGKNVAFLSAHEKEVNALKATGMWFPQLQRGGGGGGDDLNP